MLETALSLDGPSVIRFPKTPSADVGPGAVEAECPSRLVRRGDGSVCLLAVGKLVEAAEEAADKLASDGIEATVWDVRVVSPPDPGMLADAARHGLVLTVEDGSGSAVPDPSSWTPCDARIPTSSPARPCGFSARLAASFPTASPTGSSPSSVSTAPASPLRSPRPSPKRGTGSRPEQAASGSPPDRNLF